MPVLTEHLCQDLEGFLCDRRPSSIGGLGGGDRQGHGSVRRDHTVYSKNPYWEDYTDTAGAMI